MTYKTSLHLFIRPIAAAAIILLALVLAQPGQISIARISIIRAQSPVHSPSRMPLPDFDIRADRFLAQVDPPAASTRNTINEAPPARADRRPESFSARSPSVVRWSSVSGGVSRIYDLQATLSTPSGEAPETIARNFLRRHQDAFQLGSTEVDGLRAIRRHQTTHNGLTHLTLQQEIAGIEIFHGAMTLHLDRAGSVIAAGGELYPDAARRSNPSRPPVSAVEALRTAAGYAGTQLRNREVVASPPEGPAAAQKIDRSAGFSRPVTARLVYFPLTADELRLAWEFNLWRDDTPDAYLMLVDAENLALLYRYNFTWYDSNPLHPHGRVFTGESPRPSNPYIGNNDPPVVEREDKPFRPEPFNGAELFDISDPHYDWWAGRPGNNLISNNTKTHLDRDSMPNQPDLPLLEAPTGDFSFPLNFALAPTADDNAKAAQVNLFYWINRYHDILYRFGFTEAAGNFQTDNFGLGGQGQDAIEADAQDGSGVNNANFSSPSDGVPGRVQMYLWTGTTPQIDGDFDQGVIIHELTHGLSSRLIGNSSGLIGMQARGMGEGWSDYFALVLLRDENDDPNGAYPIGQYVTNRYSSGIRRFPYSTLASINPLTFARIADNPEVHPVGEIWCSALWEMRAFLIERYGFREGQRQSLQLVVDGMKLTPSAPTFVEARDAILLADRVNNQGANLCLLWKAFAKRGLGFSARTTDPSETSPKEAFDEAPYCSDTATIALDRSGYLAGETIRIRLGDRNAGAQASVQITSDLTGDSETVALQPDEFTQGSYTADIRIISGRARPGDGVVQGAIEGNDVLRVSYQDEQSAGGAAATVSVTAGVARERAIYADDVEAGNRGWIASGTWAIDNRAFSSASRSWRVASIGNSIYQPAIALTSPLFDLTGVTDVALHFAQSHDLFNGFNYGIIEYSTDDGATWSRGRAWTGSRAAFTSAVAPLPGLDGQSRARFRFRLQNPVVIGSNFWAIDDIQLTGRSGQAGFIPPGAASAPWIGRLTPAFAEPGGGTEITVFGNNFTESSDMALTFDNAPATLLTVVSPGVLKAIVPPHAPGHAAVRIVSRRGATTFAPGFTYIDAQATPSMPTIEAIVPGSGSLKGVTAVTIYGSGFLPTTDVTFDQSGAAVVFVNSTTLVATAPLRGAPGTADVSVQNGGMKSTLATAFTYLAATPPQLQILSPSGGEVFHLGGSIPVIWQSADNSELRRHQVQIVYPIGTLVTTDQPGDARSTLIPLTPGLPPETQARIRVTAFDDEGTSVEAISEPFTIRQRWERRANLPTSLQRLQVAGADQFLYAIGGRNGTSHPSTQSTVFRYDPMANIWSNQTPSEEMLKNAPTGLNSGDAVFINGKIYIPGGFTSSSSIDASHLVYNVEANTWATAPNQPNPVANYSIAADQQNVVYHLTGGTNFVATPTATARTFRPATNEWNELPPMNVGRFGHESIIIDGRLYVAGGFGPGGGLTSVEVYDFVERKWSSVAGLNSPRAYATGVLARDPAGNPMWVLIGGLNTATNNPLGAEVYDLRHDRWLMLDTSFNLSVPRAFFGGDLIGSVFYAVGGANVTFSSNAVESIELERFLPTVENQPPVLIVPSMAVGVAGESMQFEVKANDLGERTGVTIETEGLPPDSTFTLTNPTPNSAVGRFTWTPQAADTGKIFTIVFRAGDGNFVDIKTVRIHVVEAALLTTVNAADFRQAPVAPDSIAAAFGEALSIRTETAAASPLPQEISGTRVLVNGEPAPLFFVSPGQVNFVIPPGVKPGEASVIIVSGAGRYAFGKVIIENGAPAIFTSNSTGAGNAAALATPDGVFYQLPPFDVSIDGRPNILLLFGTGVRFSPADDPFDDNGVAEAVQATIDGLPAAVHYAGAQGQFSGLDQLNVEIPAALAGGPERRVEVRLSINGMLANIVSIVIK